MLYQLPDGKYYDKYTGDIIEPENYAPYFTFNNQRINLTEIKEYDWTYPDTITQFSCGNGVMIEASFQKQVVKYRVENIPNAEGGLKNESDSANAAEQKLLEVIRNPNPDPMDDIIDLYKDYQAKYNILIDALDTYLSTIEEGFQGEPVSK